RDDGHVALGQGIQQARLPRIGRAQQHDAQPLRQTLSGRRARQFLVQLRRHFVQRRPALVDQSVRQILVREVDSSLKPRQGPQQTLPPVLQPPRQRATGERQRLPPLQGCLRLDQVGQPLNRRQIEASVIKGPAGEL